MRAGKCEVFEGRDGQWYWRLKAGNGQVVGQSEGYVTRAGARRGARTVIRVALRARVVV